MIAACVVIVVVGVLLWAVNTYVPMAAPMKRILTAVVVIALVLWLLGVFGLLNLPAPGRVRF